MRSSIHTLPKAAAAALTFLAQAHAGTWSYQAFSGDSTSQVGSDRVYTALADFAGNGTRSVNGVTFTDTGVTGANYALTDTTNNFGGFGNNATGSMNGVLSDFSYTGSTGNATLTLSGLTVGKTYETTWYNAGFGPAGGRRVDITAGDFGKAVRFDENFSGAGNGNMLRYTFTATAPTQTYSFDAVGNTDSYHHYAFSNAEVKPFAQPLQLVPPSYQTAVAPTSGVQSPPFAPFTPSNTDLLQQPGVLLGTNSSGNFTQGSSGGVPVLNNGVFQIGGGNPADNSQFATGGNNTWVEYVFDTGTYKDGFDITGLDIYGGWNDGGRDRQLFDVYYSLVGEAGYNLLANVDFSPDGTANPSAVLTSLGTDLTRVDAIRFNFLEGQENGYAGYGEIDIFGYATPEPGKAVLSLFAVAGILARRKRE